MLTYKNMKKKYYYIDFLRIFSMFAVVFLHTASDLLRTEYNEAVWHFSNVLTSLFSVSVPIFFMISGVMLLSGEKSSSIKDLYRIRLKKIVLPFLFWSLFALIYYFLTEYIYYGTLNFSALKYRVTHFLSEPVTIHLWFMYALIPIYIILPFLKILVDNINKKQSLYLFLIWLVFSVLTTTVQNFLTGEYKSLVTFNYSFNLNIIGGYVGFFVLGYYLHNIDFKVKRKYLIIFIILDIFIISLGTYIIYILKNGYFENFKVYSGIFTASLSIAVFLLFKDIFKNKENVKFPKLLNIVSETSFGIYLIHNLVINFFNLNYFIQPEGGILFLLLRFILIYLISFVVIYVLSLIKPLCFIATGTKYRGRINEKN